MDTYTKIGGMRAVGVGEDGEATAGGDAASARVWGRLEVRCVGQGLR